MSVGFGLAVAGIWAFPIASLFAPEVTGFGVAFAAFVAVAGTAIVAAAMWRSESGAPRGWH